MELPPRTTIDTGSTKVGEKRMDLVEDREVLNRASTPIEGPVLKALWENLKLGSQIHTLKLTENSVLDVDSIKEAIKSAIKTKSVAVPAELTTFLNSPDTKSLAMKLGVELDPIDPHSDKQLTAATKIIMFLYYRQCAINIANAAKSKSDISFQNDIEKILPERTRLLELKLASCIEEATKLNIFTKEEKIDFLNFTSSKVRISLLLAYFFSKEDGDKNKTWNELFGSAETIGMRQYRLLLESSQKLHISLEEGIQKDFLPGMGYKIEKVLNKKSGNYEDRLAKREITLVGRNKRKYKREVDSRATIISEYNFVIPVDSDNEFIAAVNNKNGYLPGIQDYKSISEQKRLVLDLIKLGLVNSTCDPLKFRLMLQGKFDTGLLNEVANRNIAYPAAIISRFVVSLYKELGNDMFALYKDYTKDKESKKLNPKAKDIPPDVQIFWEETNGSKGFSGGKVWIGNHWPAFALFYSRIDYLKRSTLRYVLGVQKVPVIFDETTKTREAYMDELNVRGLENAPVYVKDSDGELKEICIRPVLAEAYDFLLKELGDKRLCYNAEPTAEKYVRGIAKFDVNLFKPVSIVLPNDSRSNFMMSYYPKFEEIFKTYDGLFSPGSSEISLLVPAQVNKAIEAIVHEGAKSKIKDKMEKYLGAESTFKGPLITAALLTVAHVVWHENLQGEIGTIISAREDSFLGKIIQIRNVIGNRLFSMNKPDNSLVRLASYPWVSFLVDLYDRFSDSEKRLIGAPETNDVFPTLYKASMWSSFFKGNFKTVEERSHELLKLVCDLNAIKNWLDLDKAKDLRHFIGAYTGDILQNELLRLKKTNEKLDMSVLPFVRSNQTSLIKDYLVMRGKILKEDISEFDEKTLEYFSQNGLNNDKGRRLAQLMAEDFVNLTNRLSVELPSKKYSTDPDVARFDHVFSDPQLSDSTVLGFLKRIHENFILVLNKSNPSEIIDGKWEFKKSDGFMGIPTSAYAYRDTCAALFSAYNSRIPIDTLMEDSFAGEAAGEAIMLYDEITESMNNNRLSGENMDLNISQLNSVLSASGDYKTGKKGEHDNRIDYFEGYPYNVLSRLPDTITCILMKYGKALAPLSPGFQLRHGFTNNTFWVLDSREVETHPTDKQKDLTVQKIVTNAFNSAFGARTKEFKGILDEITLKVFAGYSPSSGKSEGENGVLKKVINGFLGWQAKSIHDEELIEKKKEEEGVDEEGVHVKAVNEVAIKASQDLRKNLGALDSATKGVRNIWETVKKYPGKGGIVIDGAIFAAAVSAIVGISPIFGFPIGAFLTVRYFRRWDSNLVNKVRGNPLPLEDQFYTFATQKLVIERVKDWYYKTRENPKGRWHRLWGGLLSYLPLNSSLRAEDVVKQIDILANLKLPKEPK